jgi:CheY-like chemotaxis protein
MTAADRSGWRILVMEDDGLLAMHISDTLDELGQIVVGPARTVEDALALIENERIDMALLDVNLGNGETSYPVADILSRQGVPFAFLTGYGEDCLRGDSRDRPVISKPINETNLADTLRELRSTSTGD